MLGLKFHWDIQVEIYWNCSGNKFGAETLTWADQYTDESKHHGSSCNHPEENADWEILGV